MPSSLYETLLQGITVVLLPSLGDNYHDSLQACFVAESGNSPVHY